MPLRTVKSGPFVPTAPLVGELGDNSLFRKINMITQGRDGVFYEQSFAGMKSYGENFTLRAISGTLALTAGSTTITGSGTDFLTSLRIGQDILAKKSDNTDAWLLVVKQINSDTEFICGKAPDGSTSGALGYFMKRAFDLNNQRGVLETGNSIKLEKGSLLTVGSGVLYINGSVLAGSSLTASRKPQLSLLDPNTGDYTNFILGMDTPAAPALASIAGGTKGQQAGNYSIVITPNRKETGGFNNPSNRADVTLTMGDQIEITFPAMDTANGQNAWGIWATLYSDSLGADLNYLNGPWHLYGTVDDTVVSPAGGTYDIEYLDAEIERNDIITFDNFAPVDSEFVAYINGLPVYISCQGQGNASNPDATSPGPFIVPAKFENPEGVPLQTAYSTSPPETIIGFTLAQGTLYLLTQTHLQISIGTPQSSVPVLVRPFWKDGFMNPDQVTFVNGNLYGFPNSGPSMSVSTGDEQTAEKAWAAFVAEITSKWNPSQVKSVHDPKNNAICFFHAADHRNAAGFWTTAVLMYGLAQAQWIGYIVLSSDTEDTIVSGVATVGDSLDFVSGGRGSGSPTQQSRAFDIADGTPVSWMLTPQLSDSGISNIDKILTAATVTGLVTNASFKIYRYGATDPIDVDAIEAGTGAATPNIALADTTQVTQSRRYQINVPRSATHTIQVNGIYSGSGPLNRIDQLAVEWAKQGCRR